LFYHKKYMEIVNHAIVLYGVIFFYGSIKIYFKKYIKIDSLLKTHTLKLKIGIRATL
jgi:hypothetical protein